MTGKMCGKAKNLKYWFQFTLNWLKLHKEAMVDLGLTNVEGCVTLSRHSVSINCNKIPLWTLTLPYTHTDTHTHCSFQLKPWMYFSFCSFTAADPSTHALLSSLCCSNMFQNIKLEPHFMNEYWNQREAHFLLLQMPSFTRSLWSYRIFILSESCRSH